MNRNQTMKTMSTVIRPAVMLVIALGLTVGDAAAAAAQLQKYAEAWPEKGELTIMRKGRAYDFQAGRGKIALAIGDVIRTHKDSKVKIILEDENTVVLGSNAVMEIKPWQSGKTRGFLKGLLGSIAGWTSKEKKAPLYMQTTNATCGIRGTTFTFIISPNVTNMSILEGSGGIRVMPVNPSTVQPFNSIPPGMSVTALGNGSGNVYMNQIDPLLMNAVAGFGSADGPGAGAGPGGPGAGPAGSGAGPGNAGAGGPGAGPAVPPPTAGSGLSEMILSGDLDVHLNFDVDLSTGAVPQNLGLGNAPLPTFNVDRSEATVVASVSPVVREPVVAPPSGGPSGMLLPESGDPFVSDSPNVIPITPERGLPMEAPAGPRQPGGAVQPGGGSPTTQSVAPPPPPVIVLPPIPVIPPEVTRDKAKLNIKFEK